MNSMKNRIKGAFLTLLMLFATLYPSAQGYANGLPPSVMTALEKNSFVEELVNDTDFIKYTLSCAFIMLSFKSKLETLTAKEKFNSLEIKKELSSLSLQNFDKINLKFLINEIGISESTKFEILFSKIDELKLKIISKYPQFMRMKGEDISEITEKLRSSETLKRNINETLAAAGNCYEEIGISYVGCVLFGGTLYNAFIALGWTLCVLGSIVLAALSAAIGQAEFDEFFIPAAEACLKAATYEAAISIKSFAACSTVMTIAMLECWHLSK